MKPYLRVLEGYQQLPYSAEELGVAGQLNLLEQSILFGREDPVLLKILEAKLTHVSNQLARRELMEPQALPTEGMLLGLTPEGSEVRVPTNKFTHGLIAGQTGSGKSVFAALLAAQLTPSILVDTTGTFERMPLRSSHTFVPWQSLRINPFYDKNINQELLSQVVLKEFCKNYGLIFAELLMAELTEEIRAIGETPSFPRLLHLLRTRRFPGFSKRAQYQAPSTLVLGNLLRSTGSLFNCEQGMPLTKILERNVVLDLRGLLVEHQAFLIRYLFEYMTLMPSSEDRYFFLDEGQVISKQEGFSQKILQLRHRNVHLVVSFQNCSQAPVELLGNSDLIVSFQSVSMEDRRRFASACNLHHRYIDTLAVLRPGEAVCFLPRSDWKHPFQTNVPKPEFSEPDYLEMSRRSEVLLSELPWSPLANGYSIERNGSRTERVGERSAGFDGSVLRSSEEEMFLQDVLNQRFEFCSLTERFSRLGIRSTSTQAAIRKSVVSSGVVREWTLAKGRGRPVVLTEPTEKLFELHMVRWKKTRGVLPTRAAAFFIREKLTRAGYSVVPEGGLNGKQVDLLVRDDQNKLITLEIAHSPGHELQNANHCLRESEVIRHVVVCTTRECLGEVRRAFKMRFEDLARVESLTLSEALRDEWDPFHGIGTEVRV